jgi:DNA gyrase inhibitor GyrI
LARKGGFTLEAVSPMTVAFVPLIGPYEDWGKGLMQLKGWLVQERVRVVGKPIGLFYDNPTETPASKLRSDACFPIKEKVEGKFQVKELPGGQAAETMHTGPP